jgi:chromosomal replication initiator protein
MDTLWKHVLDEIEVEVSKPIFHTFFKGTQLLSLTDSVATITVSTYMTAEYIQTRYYGLIKRILEKKTETQGISLVFISEGKKDIPKADHSSGPLFAKDLVKETRKLNRPSRIRTDYTFDTFAVSESNQLAYTAASTVATNPGSHYNPLYLYGTVGVGKTHLMHAIANKIFDEREDIKVLYLTTEEFTNEVVEAIRDKTTTQLRKKFRNINLLLLDDVQFLSGKERVQEELFHTFNTLIDKGSQIAFSSDRPPHEIKKIEARLASRFEGGLTVDISPPDFELRTAILLIKSRKYNVDLSLDLAKLAAERITDTRALEGFLIRLSSESARRTNIDERLIRTILGEPKPQSQIIRPDSVINTICSFYNIKSTQLKGTKRDAILVRPRHVCMFLLKEEAGLTHVEIGNLLGGRDHTTVMHGVEKVRLLLSKSDKTREEIMFIKNKIKEDFLQ